MTDQTNIIEKIQSLLKLAERDNTPENEAGNAMALVRRLLDQYNLDMAQVNSHDADNPLILEERAFHSSVNWARRLASSLARYYGCHISWYTYGPKKVFNLTGRKSAVTVCSMMWPYMIKEINRVSKVVREQTGASYDRSRRETAYALTRRLNKLSKDRESVQVGGDTTNAVAVIDEAYAFAHAQMDIKEARDIKTVWFSNSAHLAANSINLDDQIQTNVTTKQIAQ